MEVVVFLPKFIADGQPNFAREIVKSYYARNQQVVDFADVVVAFVDKTTGGTWDTIRRARKAAKSVRIFRPGDPA